MRSRNLVLISFSRALQIADCKPATRLKRCFSKFLKKLLSGTYKCKCRVLDWFADSRNFVTLLKSDSIANTLPEVLEILGTLTETSEVKSVFSIVNSGKLESSNFMEIPKYLVFQMENLVIQSKYLVFWSKYPVFRLKTLDFVHNTRYCESEIWKY